MVHINNTPVEDDVCILNPDSSSGIYMFTVKESQCHIMADNRRKQDKVKENVKRSNSVKRAAHIIKRGSLYYNNLYTVANLLSTTNTTEEPTESILQDILSLSYETLKDAFVHMGGKISGFTDLKKQTVTL